MGKEVGWARGWQERHGGMWMWQWYVRAMEGEGESSTATWMWPGQEVGVGEAWWGVDT